MKPINKYLVNHKIGKSQSKFDPYNGNTHLETNKERFADGDFFVARGCTGYKTQIYGKFKYLDNDGSLVCYYFVDLGNNIKFDASCCASCDDFEDTLTKEQIKNLEEIDEKYNSGWKYPKDVYSVGHVDDNGKVYWLFK